MRQFSRRLLVAAALGLGLTSTGFTIPALAASSDGAQRYVQDGCYVRYDEATAQDVTVCSHYVELHQYAATPRDVASVTYVQSGRMSETYADGTVWEAKFRSNHHMLIDLSDPNQLVLQEKHDLNSGQSVATDGQRCRSVSRYHYAQGHVQFESYGDSCKGP